MAIEGESAPPTRRALEKKRRQRERIKYLQCHRDSLERIAQHCVNRVLYDAPADPYAALLDRLSEHTKAGVRFGRLGVCPRGAEEVCCEVVALARGVKLCAHRAYLPRTLVARGLAAACADEGGPPLEEAEQQDACTVAARLSSVIQGVVRDVEIVDLADVHRRLCAAIDAGKGAAATSQEAAVAAAALRNALGEVLLDATGRLLGSASLEVARSALSAWKLELAEPLQCQEDLQVWQHSWPRLLLPAVDSDAQGRRLCVGVTLWAATLPEAVAGGSSLVLVDEVAGLSRQANLEETQAEIDENAEHDVDEYCPPLNAVPLAAKLAASVAGKVAEDGPSLATEEDIASALSIFKKSLEAVVPPQMQSELEEERSSKLRQSVSSGTELESQNMGSLSLIEEQQFDCVYCALDFDADKAFNADTGLYSFCEGGTERTAEQLADYYAGLCREEPLLRTLVRPFSLRDPARQSGLDQLCQQLPSQVTILEQPGDLDSQATGSDSDACKPSESCGLIRDVELGACGLAAQYQARSELFSNRHGLYDFAAGGAELMPMIASYLHVALAIPERSRQFVLPKSASAEDLESMLQPFASCIRGLLADAYAQIRPTDGREKKNNLNNAQFREGLRRLGYEQAGQYADLLFNFLDVSRGRSLSVPDLQFIEHVSGPATFQQLDELRLWVCEWHATQLQRKQSKEGGEVDTSANSPLAMLMHRLDAVGSGKVAFNDFSRGFRKMKHPAAVANDVGRLRELFMCFDLKSAGAITAQDLHCLNIFSARYQLKCVILVRTFLEGKFGSLKAAFKAMDDNRSGSLPAADWIAKMTGPHGYKSASDLEACLSFIDKDGARTLTSKEFEALAAFSEESFMQDMLALQAQAVEKYGGVAAAFEAFGANAQKRGGEGLEPKDFLSGCRLLGLKSQFDPRLLFNFLDAMHIGRVQRADFMLLERLGVIEEHSEVSEQMRAAITSLKDFANSGEQDESPDADKLWSKLHTDLREVTQGDFF